MRLAALFLLACFAPVLSNAGSIGELQVFDRTTGSLLPIYEHRGRLYVAGEPQHRYEIRVRNATGKRVLAVASVDGVNVITGETASQQQSGYVLDSHGEVLIDGWRKSLDDVARFYFTRLSDSYAARTGRPDDVGVIGVALFSERSRCCEPFELDESARDAAPSVQEQGAAAPRAESRVGTGHGERTPSSARYVEFERRSSTPDETLVIYYDSRRNLIAQGVIPQPRFRGKIGPRPFPNGFVPDP